MTDTNRFSKYVVIGKSTGGANTLGLARDLAKEWDGMVYVRIDLSTPDAQQRARAAAESLTRFIDPYFRLNRDWVEQVATVILKHFTPDEQEK